MSLHRIKSHYLNRMIHIGIVVRDMDDTIKRLETYGLGPFEPFNSNSLPPFQTEPLYQGKPLKPDCKVFVAKVGGIEFELFEPGSGESPWKEFLDTNGEGIHHLAFSVKDINSQEAFFTSKGAKVILTGRWQDGGSVYLDLGAGEIIIELEER